MKGIFVTGTGTEVGKTFVSCAIARLLAGRGAKPGVMKPVASGGTVIKGKLSSADALLLKKAAGSSDSLELINPVCFKAPLAPYCASLIEKEKFSLARVMAAYRKIIGRHSFTIVEGIGGVRVPLNEKLEVADLICAMRLPAVVVASAKLGTLNHTLLTLDCLKRKKIDLLGIVLNFFDAGGAVDRSNLDYFVKRGIPVLAVIPKQGKFGENFKQIDARVLNSSLGQRILFH